MKLTKKQREAVDELRRQAVLSRALAWPSFGKPEPMTLTDEVQHGWSGFGTDRISIQEAWQTNSRRYNRDPRQEISAGRYVSGYRDTVPMYSSPEDATKAAICDIAVLCAERLAKAYDLAGIDLCPLPVELADSKVDQK